MTPCAAWCVRRRGEAAITDMAGLGWEGDLDATRSDQGERARR